VIIQLHVSPQFERDLQKIGSDILKRVEKSLRQFVQNPSHPGLNFEMMAGYSNRFSIRAGKNHRILLKKCGLDCYTLLRIANHDVYRKL